MTLQPMPGTTAKPLAKYAAVVAGTEQPAELVRARVTFGFGSKGASKRWTPSVTDTRPATDWWQKR